MLVRKYAALLAVSALSLSAGIATAADYDPPIFVEEAEEYVPVEVGSGWYIRGDIAYSAVKPFDFEELDSFEQKDNYISAGLGMGYQFNEWIRSDLNVSMLSGNEFSREYVSSCGGTQTTNTSTTTTVLQDQTTTTIVIDPLTGLPTPVTTVTQVPVTTTVASASTGASSRPCPGSDHGENTAYTGIVNGYVDLGTFAGVTPYVGGGVGVAYTRYRSEADRRLCYGSQIVSGGAVPNGTSTTTTTFLCQGQTEPTDDPVPYAGAIESDKEFGLAYSLAAGFAYDVSKNVKLDLGYQYVSLPGAEYVVAEGTNNIVKSGIDYHQVKLGMRYSFW